MNSTTTAFTSRSVNIPCNPYDAYSKATKVKRPATLKQRLTTLLLEIFEGHEEHLGLAPD
ncbi:MAG TPA: hypothetical protein VNO32_47690 [Candidatus Acidoferrum sp.]|nr:hypothetical protein [Candidatus Acidoferrum sp.]